MKHLLKASSIITFSYLLINFILSILFATRVFTYGDQFIDSSISLLLIIAFVIVGVLFLGIRKIKLKAIRFILLFVQVSIIIFTLWLSLEGVMIV